MDIHAVCRICLEYSQNDKSYDLFLVPGLAKKLCMCTSLSVDPQDGFPKNICGVCYTRLSDMADFQKLCDDSVQKFQEFLANNAFVCAPTFNIIDAPATAPIKDVQMLETVDKEEVEEMPTKVEEEKSDDSSDSDMDSDEDFPEEFPDIGESCDNDDDSDIADDNPLATGIRSIAKEIKENEKPETDNKDPKIKPNRKMTPAAELHLYGIIECHICQQKFKKTNTYEKHMKYHNDKLPFQCAVENCKRGFNTAFGLRVHTFKHNGRELPFPCNICGKRFKINRALKHHLMRHAEIKSYLCAYCGVYKTTLQEWKTHIATHNAGKKFKCQYCDKQFDKSNACQMHEMTHTGEIRSECKVCGKRFKFGQGLTRHLKSHVKCVLRAIEVYRKRKVQLGEAPAADAEPIPDLPNPVTTQESHQKVADEILKVWADFVKSIPKDPRHVADIAGIAVHTIPQVVPKINIMMKEGKYVCPHCGQGFNSTKNLRRHHKSVHQCVKRLACRYCQKPFAKAYSLKYHEMTHTGEKPHACSLCDMRFIKAFDLKRHMNVHQKRLTYRNNKALANMPKVIPNEGLPPGADMIATNVLPGDLVNATNAATTSTTDAENTENSTSDSVFKIEIQENYISYSEVMDNY